MFNRKKNEPPAEPFSHAPNCAIVRADPGYEPPWSKIERGTWKRECQCSAEYWHEPFVEHRTRLDPLEPANARHAPQCEYRDTTNPVLIKAILRVREGGGGGYWWVECSMCECGWQVPHFVEGSVA